MVTTAIRYQPMQLVHRSDAFDDPDWFFELRWDGWRSLAYISGGRTTLISRNGNSFRRTFPVLASFISFQVNADDAVLDGEIVKLAERIGEPGPSGRHISRLRDELYAPRVQVPRSHDDVSIAARPC